MSGLDAVKRKVALLHKQTKTTYCVQSLPEVEKVVDTVSLTRRKYFQKLGLTENIWGNIIG